MLFQGGGQLAPLGASKSAGPRPFIVGGRRALEDIVRQRRIGALIAKKDLSDLDAQRWIEEFSIRQSQDRVRKCITAAPLFCVQD